MKRLCLLIILALANAHADDWPAGYVVYQGSRSPDGHYGIVLPGRETGTGEEGEDTNYLADLTTHQLLGKIADEGYFEGQNHRGLKVVWSPDSKWCVATYDERYGFGSIFILEPTGSQFRQTNIGEHMQKALDAVIAKQAHNAETGGYGMEYFRIGPDRKLRVRALAYTNPKQFEEVPTYNALFEGAYDLNAKKWTASTARKIGTGEWDALQSAYPDYTGKDFIVIKDPAKEKVPDDFVGSILSSDEEKTEFIEKKMNEVYQGVRFVLPASRFAKVKEEQIVWLKKRAALGLPEEKWKVTEARIRTLQELLWEQKSDK